MTHCDEDYIEQGEDMEENLPEDHFGVECSHGKLIQYSECRCIHSGPMDPMIVPCEDPCTRVDIRDIPECD